MATVFLNGRFVSRDEAKVSAFDAGFQHGVGLFETFTAVRSSLEGAGFKVVHLHEHLKRLALSARELGLSETVRIGPLEEAVARTVERACDELRETTRFRVRLTVTGGDLNMIERGTGAGGEAGQEPTLMIVASPATVYPAAMFEQGVGVVLADLKVNPLDSFSGHKTLNYWARLRELQVAAGKRAGEALVFQVTNHLAGGCVSNAVLVKGTQIITPIARGEEIDVASAADPAAAARSEGVGRRSDAAVMPSPVLPGITRRWVLDWAEEEAFVVSRRMVSIDDVLGADELILTNSSWGVLPVVRVEAQPIGDGTVGPVAKRLSHAWRGVLE